MERSPQLSGQYGSHILYSCVVSFKCVLDFHVASCIYGLLFLFFGLSPGGSELWTLNMPVLAFLVHPSATVSQQPEEKLVKNQNEGDRDAKSAKMSATRNCLVQL